MKQYAEQYHQELMNNIIPFWEKHSKDNVHGGFFTCLDRYGEVFDTDKFIWLQGREVWCFSMLYDQVEKKKEWLEMAQHGAAFLQHYGRDADGNWFFSLNQAGEPLVQAYNIFSDCFAAMAFAGLHKIDPQPVYKEIALTTFSKILERKENPKGPYNKVVAGTRPLKNFALPMILCNLALEMEHLVGPERVNELVLGVIDEVMNIFYKPELGVVLENVQPDGSYSDSFEGRLLNPGHAIEAMWFIMDLGKRMNDQALIDKACKIMLYMIEYGWDKEYGGIFYFLDVQGRPPQQLEWDQKLWWVHMETLVALAKGFALTGNPACERWFETIHNYSWKHFKDPEYLEWFGYLNRRGEVLLPLKGGKWKGCFHYPRAMYQVWKTLRNI